MPFILVNSRIIGIKDSESSKKLRIRYMWGNGARGKNMGGEKYSMKKVLSAWMETSKMVATVGAGLKQNDCYLNIIALLPLLAALTAHASKDVLK